MTYDPRIHPWLVQESEFFEIDDAKTQREFLLRYAMLAPSGHNTQPWKFRVTSDAIEVFADFSRRLPVADPANRELMISIGAAVANIRVAGAHFGFDSAVTYQPASDEETPVATLTFTETCNPDETLRRLFASITKRRTLRTEFDAREIEPETLDRLCEFVDAIEVARFVPPHERSAAAELVEKADRLLLADEEWRRELAEWVRPNDSADGDGMSGDAFGIPGPLSAFAPWLIRSFDIGESRGRHDRQLAEKAAGLIVIASDDDPASLLRAGESLERLLLFFTSVGIAYAFLNQPIEVPELRRELWTLMRTAKPPQLLIRIGYARPPQLAMPRRRLQSVTV